MSLFQAVLFGMVEGISEFLPISSTGHLILTARILGFNATEFLKSFEVAIQTGAILAVVVLYWRRLFVDKEVLKRVVAACVPTLALGFVFYHAVKKYLLASEEVVLWALFVGGIFLVLFEWVYREKETSVAEVTARLLKTMAEKGLFLKKAIAPVMPLADFVSTGAVSRGDAAAGPING